VDKDLQFLFVNIGYYPFIGGSQLYCQWLAERLVADGHRVTVFTTDALEVESIWNKEKPHLPRGSERIGGVEVIRYPIRHLPPSPYSFYLIKRATVALSALPFAPKQLLRYMSRYTPWVPEMSKAFNSLKDRIDLLHVFTIPFESLMIDAISYANRMEIPVVATPFIHTGREDDMAVKRSYTMPHQIDILKQCDAVTVLTDIEGYSLRASGVPGETIFKVGAGIPKYQYDDHPDSLPEEQNDSSYKVLFLGAATYEKGAVHLLEAVRALNHRGVNVHLLIAGTVVDHFMRHIENLAGTDRSVFTLLGKVTEEDKHQLLHSCDLLAMPSRVDSFGLVYLEAWSHQKAVIGAKAGGVPEVIADGQDGRLVEFGDVPGLADAIEELLKDKDERDRLGRNGYAKLLKCYTLDRVYSRMVDVYEKVLKA